uniref:SH2 domain-containing protein n=1 Tax=Panagrolaimus superbus TaxID=310955 RepID=A0A914Z662_9BILA
MEEEHYDTPWEYKTRLINALRPRPHSSNIMMPSCSGEQAQFENNLNNHKSMIIRASESGSPSSPPQAKFLKKTSNFKETFPSTNISSATPDLGQSRRRRTEIPSGATTAGIDYPYIKNVTNSRSSSGVAASLAKKLPHEDELIHENIDRLEAEYLLNARKIGDFLLRKRQEGNLALSLKASEGVLHIKLEKRDNNHWVLGEGPQFPSITGCLRFYYRKALPIRGSEHVVLKSPLLATLPVH